MLVQYTYAFKPLIWNKQFFLQICYNGDCGWRYGNSCKPGSILYGRDI